MTMMVPADFYFNGNIEAMRASTFNAKDKAFISKKLREKLITKIHPTQLHTNKMGQKSI